MKTTYLRSAPIRIIALATILAMLLCLLPAGTREASAATNLRNPRTSGETVTWDCVWFGHYPQSLDGYDSWPPKFKSEPIKWRVLSVDGNEALLLADKSLATKMYKQKFINFPWADSMIRSWLNGYDKASNGNGTDDSVNNFIGEAFTKMEQTSIINSGVKNTNESGFRDGATDRDTEDKIFLLSEEEVKNKNYGLEKSGARIASETDYSHFYVDHYLYKERYWWLRSAYKSSAVACVTCDGDITYLRDLGSAGVRPALRLNLTSNLWSYAGTVSSNGKVDETGGNPGEPTDPTDPTASTLTMSKSSVTAEAGSSCYITADLKLAEGDSLDPKKDLVWTSSNESVLKFVEYKCIESSEDSKNMTVMAEFQALKEGKATVSVQMGSQKKTCTVTVGKAGQSIQGSDSGSASSKLKIGNDVSFKVPSDVPLIGGGDVSLDFGNIPIQFEQEDNTFRLGIGISADLKKWELEEWTNFKKFVDSQQESYRKGIDALLASKFGVASMGMSVKPKIECYGYAEGTIGQAGLQSCGGRMMVKISVKADNEWQTTVVVVPVVIKFSGEVGVKTEAAIGLDFEHASVYCNSDLGLTLPKLRLSVGVGIAYIADISVYGTGENKLVVKSSSNGGTADQQITGTLSGAAGVSAKALCFSYEKELLSGDWKYYDSKNNGAGGSGGGGGAFALGKSLDDENWTIHRANPSAWKGAKAASAFRSSAASGQVETLQSNAYDNGKPYLVQTESGKKVMVYTADLKNRITGNHTAVVYSMLNEHTGVWSEPAVIDDDGTGDYYPSVTAKGDSVYVAWTNASKAFTRQEIEQTDFPEKLSSACEIEVAAIDASTGQVAKEQLTKNSVLDYKPSVCNDNGTITVGWISNAKNDIFTMSGTNKIYTALQKGSKWETAERASETRPITDLSLGNLKGSSGALAAYTVDKSGKSTKQSSSLYVADSKKKKTLVKDGGICLSPSFGAIGTQQLLAWYNEQGGSASLNYITEPGSKEKKLCGGELAVTRDFEIVSGKGNQALLVCASAKEEGDGSNIAAYVLNGISSSELVPLTDTKGYAVSPTGLYDEDSWLLAFLRKDVSIGSASVKEKADLCAVSIVPEQKLEIGNLDFIGENMMPGEKENINISITNNGLENCSSYVVQVKDRSEVISEATVNATLKPGETKEVSVAVSLPQNMAKNTSYAVQAVPKSGSGGASADQKITVGQVDTELTVEEKKGTYTAKARNLTSFATSAKLVIRNTDASGSILETHNLGTLEPYGEKEQELDKKALAAKADSLYLELDTGEKELFDSNNTAYLYVGSDVIASLKRISASKKKATYKTGQKLSLSDLKVYANYSDKTKKAVKGYTTNASKINMKTAGTKKLTITYEENFTVRTVTIPIKVTKSAAVAKPKKVAGIKVKSAKKTLTVTWKRDTKASGYQVLIAQNSKFTKGKKVVTVKNNKTTKTAFKKLKSKKTYYVKVQAYKTAGGKKLYGPYSKVKKARMK